MSQIVATFSDLTLPALRSIVNPVQRSVTVFGKTHPQPRLTEWFGPTAYTYSGLRWEAKPMPAEIQDIAARITAVTGQFFDCCLVNLYRDGSDTVGWHSDDEPLFGLDGAVASVSVGAARTFKLRLKQAHDVTRTHELGGGTVLYMPPGTQRDWEHCLPRTARPVGERLNLTFRQTKSDFSTLARKILRMTVMS